MADFSNEKLVLNLLFVYFVKILASFAQKSTETKRKNPKGKRCSFCVICMYICSFKIGLKDYFKCPFYEPVYTWSI